MVGDASAAAGLCSSVQEVVIQFKDVAVGEHVARDGGIALLWV